MKKYVAECIGTFVLTFLGCGTAMFLGCGDTAGVVGTAIAFGLSVVAMAYTIGGISGCHINPAITFGVALSGRMKWGEAVGYWIGQIVGAIIAGAVLMLIVKVTGAPGAMGNPAGLGTNGVAIIAKYYKVPLYVFAPTSTIDPMCPSGDDIVIEERPAFEVTDMYYERPMAPKGVQVYNPAFDVTPASLITGIVTEKGILKPKDVKTLLKKGK